MMTSDQDDKAWHLDKKVPLALIATLMIQTGIAVWWVSSLNSQVDNIDGRVKELETVESGRAQRRDAIQQQLSDIKSSMSALNERSKSTVESLGEVKRAVEVLTQKLIDTK